VRTKNERALLPKSTKKAKRAIHIQHGVPVVEPSTPGMRMLDWGLQQNRVENLVTQPEESSQGSFSDSPSKVFNVVPIDTV
jgi:hypothetical protein